jgi:hypothetical protein
MDNSNSTPSEETPGPFGTLSENPKYWQQTYASAVAIAQIMQKNGVDPHEAKNLYPHDIHLIFMSAKLYTFDEQLIFDLAIQLLGERHTWSYGN